MHLSSQHFFGTLHKTIKFQEKYIFKGSTDLNFENWDSELSKQ